MQIKNLLLALAVAAISLATALPPTSHDLVKPRSPIYKSRLKLMNLNKPGRTPWMAWSLAWGIKDDRLCGGILLNSRLVLTARHCVNLPDFVMEKFEVRVGSQNITENFVSTGVEQIIFHPDEAHLPQNTESRFYQESGFVIDLAILQLNRDVAPRKGEHPEHYFVDYAKLPAPTDAWHAYTKATTFGWGVTETGYDTANLRKLDLMLIPTAVCFKNREQFKIPFPGQSCTINTKYLGNICNGDSGGPLVSGGRVIGILSGMSGDCHRGRMHQYWQPLAPMVPWIESVKSATRKNAKPAVYVEKTWPLNPAKKQEE